MPLNEIPRRTLAAAREGLLLEGAERRVCAYAEAAIPTMRALVRAGNDRADLANAAVDDHAAAALTLYREAALFYMAALVTVRSGTATSEPLRADDVVGRFEALGLSGAAPDGLANFLESVRHGQPSAVDPPVDEARRARAIATWLATLVDPRGVREIRFDRALRVGAASVVLLAGIGWAISLGFGASNIALHKPVTTSGLHPDAISPASALTDGVITGAPYGVHTKVAPSAWVEVDLLAVYALDEIKIYNRGDGWFDDGLPLVLQVSSNGVTFSDVDTRRTSFTQTTPWVADLHRRAARYVRVVAAPNKYVALSELQAFGRRK